MSKLDGLIRELCPDGVEYIVLNKVCEIYDGTHSTPKYTDSGVLFASVENIQNPMEIEIGKSVDAEVFIAMFDGEEYIEKIPAEADSINSYVSRFYS